MSLKGERMKNLMQKSRSSLGGPRAEKKLLDQKLSQKSRPSLRRNRDGKIYLLGTWFRNRGLHFAKTAKLKFICLKVDAKIAGFTMWKPRS